MLPENSSLLVRRKAESRRHSAFTLVELLVVIGIIALLIAVLLPSLNAARAAGQRAACAAKLHAIMIAANVHAIDHKGYWPLTGFLVGSNNTLGPTGLNDTYTSHYTYLGFAAIDPNGGDARALAPIDLALGTEMGYAKNLSQDAQSAYADRVNNDEQGLARHFLCPSQGSTSGDLTQVNWLYGGVFNTTGSYGGYTGQMSYVFNEAVLGYNDALGRLRGYSIRVKQPSKTFFAADGLGSLGTSRTTQGWTAFNHQYSQFPGPFGFFTIYNNQNPKNWTGAITLSDCLTAKANTSPPTKLAGDAVSFDIRRHKRRMNIAYCDGHVETKDIPDITKDPQAKGLMDTFIVAP